MPRIIKGNAASLRPSRRNIMTNLFSGCFGAGTQLTRSRCRFEPSKRQQMRVSWAAQRVVWLGCAADADEGQSRGGQRLEARQLLFVPGTGELAVEQRVQGKFLGDEVHDLAGDLLRVSGRGL